MSLEGFHMYKHLRWRSAHGVHYRVDISRYNFNIGTQKSCVSCIYVFLKLCRVIHILFAP